MPEHSWRLHPAAPNRKPYCSLAPTPLTGVDLLVDVHGDEELPYCFIAGSEGIPGWSDRLARLQVCVLCGRNACCVLLSSGDNRLCVGGSHRGTIRPVRLLLLLQRAS